MKPSPSIISLIPIFSGLLLFPLVAGFCQKFSVLMFSHLFSSLFDYAAQTDHLLFLLLRF